MWLALFLSWSDFFSSWAISNCLFKDKKDWLPEIYQIGVRNPQGMALSPFDDKIYLSNDQLINKRAKKETEISQKKSQKQTENINKRWEEKNKKCNEILNKIR